jgi:Fur family transcriptional regulator, ferric uptake regulator
MGEELHTTVETRLRRGRQRYTRGRRELIDLLASAGRPLTIPEVIELGADLSQSSVYRNLQVLEQVDAVRRVVIASSDGARYELAEDLTEHHHHLICAHCGSVADFHPSGSVERALERAVSEAHDAGGFTAEQHRLDLVGTCGDCG